MVCQKMMEKACECLLITENNRLLAQGISKPDGRRDESLGMEIWSKTVSCNLARNEHTVRQELTSFCTGL